MIDKTLDEKDPDIEDLEKKFKDCVVKAEEEIKEQMEIARSAIRKAEEISERYGIPFYASCSPLGQRYKPESFDSMWVKIKDNDELMELIDFVPEYDGWQHSAVCY